MIFHTSANKLYYDYFFKNYRKSVSVFYENAKFSFNYVGKEEINELDIDHYTQDSIDYDEIKLRFNLQDDKSVRGYYCMSRWISIPIVNDHVCVSDIDVLAINKIDISLIENLLCKHKVINLTRIKPKSMIEGGMMIFFLHKDICNDIKNYAVSLLNTNKLEWATDVAVRKYLYNHYNVKDLLKMQEISKSNSVKIDDPWFSFSKVSKFKNLI